MLEADESIELEFVGDEVELELVFSLCLVTIDSYCR